MASLGRALVLRPPLLVKGRIRLLCRLTKFHVRQVEMWAVTWCGNLPCSMLAVLPLLSRSPDRREGTGWNQWKRQGPSEMGLAERSSCWVQAACLWCSTPRFLASRDPRSSSEKVMRDSCLMHSALPLRDHRSRSRLRYVWMRHGKKWHEEVHWVRLHRRADDHAVVADQIGDCGEKNGERWPLRRWLLSKQWVKDRDRLRAAALAPVLHLLLACQQPHRTLWSVERATLHE